MFRSLSPNEGVYELRLVPATNSSVIEDGKLNNAFVLGIPPMVWPLTSGFHRTTRRRGVSRPRAAGRISTRCRIFPGSGGMLAVICLLAAGAIAVTATAADAPRWKTGESFERQLESITGITWSSQKLRRGLENIAETHEVAIWLDRRIDPDQEPEFAITDVTLGQGLQALAGQLDAAACRVGSVVFVGKKSAATRLATIAVLRNEEAAKLPAEVQTNFGSPRAWQWEALTTPRDLLEQLAQEAKISVSGIDQIPHDLWGKGDFPPLTLAERLTLLLGGFDLTFGFEDGGKSIKLVKLPEKPTLIRPYSPRGDVARILPQLAQAVPAAALQRSGARIVVTGTAEEHEIVRRLLSGERLRVASGEAKTVFTMTARQDAIGTILKTLQVQANLTIEVDPRAQEKLYTRVSFDVKQKTLDELLAVALSGTGLSFRLEDKRLIIVPAE